MKRTLYNLVVPLLIAVLAVGGWECTAAPKSQCQDGSTRTRTVNHHPVKEICSNGEWVKR